MKTSMQMMKAINQGRRNRGKGHTTVFDTKCENDKIFIHSTTSVECQTKIKLVTFDQICFWQKKF